MNEMKNDKYRNKFYNEIPVLIIPSTINIHTDKNFQNECLQKPIVIIKDMLRDPNVNIKANDFTIQSFRMNEINQDVNILYQKIDQIGWNLVQDINTKKSVSYFIESNLLDYFDYYEMFEKLLNHPIISKYIIFRESSMFDSNITRINNSDESVCNTPDNNQIIENVKSNLFIDNYIYKQNNIKLLNKVTIGNNLLIDHTRYISLILTLSKENVKKNIRLFTTLISENYMPNYAKPIDYDSTTDPSIYLRESTISYNKMSNILFQRLNQDQLDLLNKALDNMNNKYEIIDENIPKRNSNVSRSGIVQYTIDSNVEVLKKLQISPQPLKKKRIEVNYNLNDFPWSYQSHRNIFKDKDNKKLYEIYLPYYNSFSNPFTIPMRIYRHKPNVQSNITISSNDQVYYIEISIESATLVYSPVYLPAHTNIHKAFIEIGNYLIQSRILQDDIIFIIKHNINFLNVSKSDVHIQPGNSTAIDISTSPSSVVSYTSQTNSSTVTSSDTSIYLSASHLHDVFKGWIKFCCNIDIRLWTKYLSILYTCMPSWMMCKSSYDILRHLRQDVEGMTTPQLYIKVPGVWTGGHEENNRFRSANCNNGPGISEWYAVEHKYLSKIRSLVLKSFNIDILYKEGHWYPSIEWLESNEIPYMHGLQYPGDVILLKGQTLHWVRSLGFSIHFSWNFGYLEFEQILSSLDRYYINDLFTLNGNSFQNLVPMKTLIFDIVFDVIAYGQKYNHIQINNDYTVNRIININEMQSLLNEPLLLLRLIIELCTNIVDITQRLQEYAQLSGLIPKQEEENSIVVYCSCNREIFECYLLSNCCKYMCLHCVSNQTCKFNNQYIHELESQLLYKTDPIKLQELLEQFIEFVKTIHPNLIYDIDSSISYIKSRSSYFSINRYKRLVTKKN